MEQEQVGDWAKKSGAQIGTHLLEAQTELSSGQARCYLGLRRSHSRLTVRCVSGERSVSNKEQWELFSSGCTLLPFGRNAGFQSSAVHLFR